MSHGVSADHRLVYATQGRIFAFVIDTLLSFAILLPVAVATPRAMLTAAGFVLLAVVRALLTWRFGGTPAKLLFQVSVASAYTGERVSLPRALFREGLVVLYLAVFLGLGEGAVVPMAYVSILVDVVPFAVRSDRRSLHDLFAGTIVLDDYVGIESPTVRSD